MLNRRFSLGTALVVLALSIAGALGVLRIYEQDQRSEIGVTLSHLGEGVARLDLAARMAIDDPSPRHRLMLAVSYLSVLYHVDELRKADPANSGGAPHDPLDTLAARWLDSFTPPHDHALGAYPMSAEMLELWRGPGGENGLEASLRKVLALLEEPAMRREAFDEGLEAYATAAEAEIRRMVLLLRRGSVLSAQEQDRAAALARNAVLTGAGVGVLAMLLNHFLILRPLARRIARDRARLAQALKGANAAATAKSEFLATASHELRTPLNGVLGMASLLEATGINARQRSFVETIRRSALSLLSVIEDMLIFTRPDYTGLGAHSETFLLDDLGARPVAQLAPVAMLKGVEIVMRRAPDAPAALRGDFAKLDHVIANLLGNAVKFTDQGEICVDIAATETEGGLAQLRVEIADTGCGVAPEQAEHIFEQFRQADQSATRSAGGLGLGLSVCVVLMRLMGGRLGMRSDGAGCGAVFWLEIALPVAAAQDVEVDAARRALPPALRGRRALYVSASAARRRVGGEILDALGVAHQTAADSAAACAILSAPGAILPDFVVLDDRPGALDSEAMRVRLRDMEGCEGVAAILLQRPGAAAGPHPCDPLAEILVKPVRPLDAAAAIEAALNRADAARNAARAAAYSRWIANPAPCPLPRHERLRA